MPVSAAELTPHLAVAAAAAKKGSASGGAGGTGLIAVGGMANPQQAVEGMIGAGVQTTHFGGSVAEAMTRSVR